MFGGGITVAIDLLMSLDAIYSWLFVGQTPAGWTSLLIAIVLMGSLQLLMLGILGEYLGRIYIQTRGRPVFLIDKVVGGGDEKQSGAVSE